MAELAGKARTLLAPWFRERRFPAGELLWREGETTGLLVLIRSGHVKIYRLLPTGRAVSLFLFGPGDVFGFLPFLDGECYPGYAQAVDEVTAEVMPRADLLEAVRSKPEVAMMLFALLGRRLRDAFDRIENLSTPGVVPRVAAALQALAAQSTIPGPSCLIKLPVSAAEFAAAIGVSPETLSRAVSKLAADGIVNRTAPGVLQVLDGEALARVAGLSDG